MNIQPYLHRIGYTNDVKPDIETLKNLQKTHILNVPFENLDIHYQTPILLEIPMLYQKIVEKKRGGFCYELNSLFYTALQTIGYQVKMISARVYDDKKAVFGNEFDHLAILLTLNEMEYLVDVGFGDFTFYPLRVQLDTIQEDPRGNFVIETYKDDILLVSQLEETEKIPKYIFTKTSRMLSDFSEMCRYHQTDAASYFTQKKMITQATDKGRITISGNTLIITEGKGERQEKEFEYEEIEKYIKEFFGIVIKTPIQE